MFNVFNWLEKSKPKICDENKQCLYNPCSFVFDIYIYAKWKIDTTFVHCSVSKKEL